MTCGFAIWFAMALFKYWWNNDNYNEIYLKSAPVVQWTMASIIAFGAGPIYVFLVRAVSALNFGFGTILGATQSLVNLWSNAAISGLGFVDIIVCNLADKLSAATVWYNADIIDLEMFDFDDLRYEPILRTFDFVNMSPTEFCD